ncbi:VOC family protein [Bradyrhizobium sp. 83012]|uniref:VOC family protein n=1 Tax=Bradyrhizobium aeschynomenes TaxID=2734909 RepID=A0ABX2CC68_9BRAD|nr:VOC family protein [Bradyrhizobium aeschynomenes]NPU09811.1 VOC family protein [Bradyrhizobium aeschynomenes]NPU65723.1 VOC family protein [Bradyrhizobium aeschynomenes]
MGAEVVVPRFTVVTLGVSEMRRSIAFYASLGFVRKFQATGEAVAFFETGATVLALYPWHTLAQEAGVPEEPRPRAFRGVTLAWNCRSEAEVDAALAAAVEKGATLLKPAHPTHYGGYCGYFADPDGHVWEAVVAPGIEVGDDGRVRLPEETRAAVPRCE